jgi:hypothetical protein
MLTLGPADPELALLEVGALRELPGEAEKQFRKITADFTRLFTHFVTIVQGEKT